MESADITDWASEDIRTIIVSQVFLKAPYKVRVREFIPREGDILEEIWNHNGRKKRLSIPPYAIASITEAAESIDRMVGENQHLYLDALLPRSPADLDGDFWWDTYLFAFQYPSKVQVRLTQNLASISVTELSGN